MKQANIKAYTQEYDCNVSYIWPKFKILNR
jgi:hypothetical protein